MRLGEDRVSASLRALREESAGAEASASVEANVLAAFRTQKIQRVRRKRAALWIMAATAALVLAGLVTVANVGMEQPQVARSPHQQAAVPPAQPAIPKPTVLAQAAKSVRKARSRPVQAAQQIEPPLESWSDFVAVPYAPPLNVQDGGQVLRVRLPRSSLQSFGIPMPVDHAFDRYNAEVMVGQDGVVRAIRFAK